MLTIIKVRPGRLFLLLLFLAPVIKAQDNPIDPTLQERILKVPGDPRHPVMLEVTVFSPAGPGPFPLAVLNHGKEQVRPRVEPRYRSAYIARYFLSRGYLVALPMMRGFAGSGGGFDPQGCEVEGFGLAQARDLVAVLNFLATQPQVDATRVVVSGQSMGGWNTLALATLNYPGVKGILNFSGGFRESTCLDWKSNLIRASSDYGAKTKIPSLWFYGDNDSLFSPSVWHAMFDGYVKAGGPATLVSYGSFLKNAHNMLGSVEGFPIWMQRVDDFLVSLKLPGKLLNPAYLPAPMPPASHFARIDDVQAVPYLNENGRKLYRVFLTKPFPRVFIIDHSGGGACFDSGYDPLTRGLTTTRKISPEAQVYAVDDRVVWSFPSVPTTGASSGSLEQGQTTKSQEAVEGKK